MSTKFPMTFEEQVESVIDGESFRRQNGEPTLVEQASDDKFSEKWIAKTRQVITEKMEPMTEEERVEYMKENGMLYRI